MSKSDYSKNGDQRLALIVEQLEVSSELIKTENSSKCRMAIILLDNLIDILMYRYCLEKFSFDEFTKSIWPPKFSEKDKNKAKNDIQGKIDILRRKMKGLTQKEETIITICHSYRNDAQHNDEHNPATVIIFAKILFYVVCNFFVRSQDTGITRYYGTTIPSWAANYITGTNINYSQFSKVVVKKLSKNIKISLKLTKEVLISDIKARLKEINYIIDDVLPKMDNRRINFILKRHAFEQTDEFKNSTEEFYQIRYRQRDRTISEEEYKKQNALSEFVIKRTNKAYNEFVPNITFNTFKKIERAIPLLTDSKNLHRALRIYERFNILLEKIENAIFSAAEEWEKAQELLSDIARGK